MGCYDHRPKYGSVRSTFLLEDVSLNMSDYKPPRGWLFCSRRNFVRWHSVWSTVIRGVLSFEGPSRMSRSEINPRLISLYLVNYFNKDHWRDTFHKWRTVLTKRNGVTLDIYLLHPVWVPLSVVRQRGTVKKETVLLLFRAFPESTSDLGSYCLDPPFGGNWTSVVHFHSFFISTTIFGETKPLTTDGITIKDYRIVDMSILRFCFYLCFF